MDIYLQWAQNNAAGWVKIPHTSWLALAKRAIPSPGELGGKDDTLGWVHRLDIMSMEFAADHYCIQEPGGGVVRCITWNNDPDDHPNYPYFGREAFGWGGPWRWARVVDFYPITYDPIVKRDNLKIVVSMYCDVPLQAIYQRLGPIQFAGGALMNLYKFAAFVPPVDDLAVRHGVWVEDSKDAELDAIRTVNPWQEWVV